MGAEELILNLFDSNWFGHTTGSDSPSLSHQLLLRQEKQVRRFSDHDLLSPEPQALGLRSLSDQILDPKLGSFFSSDNSLSPSSVLADRKLDTIFSGKEAGEVRGEDQGNREAIKREISERNHLRRRRKSATGKRGSSRFGGATSKSLSELEFDELKGFMDLGFVFTEEECNDSKLVSIIPGLQRLSRKSSVSSCTDNNNHHHHRDRLFRGSEDRDGGDDDHHQGVVSRPYLSEAWDIPEATKPLAIDWKMSSLENEIFMKDQLKFWAHSVASTVR